MIYEENLIHNCAMCNTEYDMPHILPCGETMCGKCINKYTIEINKNAFVQCPYCDEKHQLPPNGFPINKAISKLLNEAPVEIYRGETYENLKSALKQIKEDCDQFNINIQYGIDKINEICSNLLNEVKMITEDKLEHIHKFSKAFSNEITNYKTECVSSFTNNSLYKETIKHFNQEIKDFYEEWSAYLNKSNPDEHEMKKAVEAATKLIESIKRKRFEFDNVLYNGKLIHYKHPTTELTSDYALGQLVYSRISIPGFEKLIKLDFKPYLIDKHSTYNQFKLQLLDDGSFLIAYYNPENHINLGIFNQDGALVSDLIKIKSFLFYLHILPYKNKIICSHYDADIKAYCLKIFNDDFKVKCAIHLNASISSIAANDKQMLVLLKSQLNFYDWELKPLMSVYESNRIGYPLCLPYETSQIDVDDYNYYFKHGNELSIISQENGSVKRIKEFECDLFRVNKNENTILAKSHVFDVMRVYDLKGELLTENNLEDYPASVNFFLIDKSNNVVFADEEHCDIYK